MTTTIAPVVRELAVAAPPDVCFTTFVDRFDAWWPHEHHLGEDRTIVSFHIEPQVGGPCYDVDTDGREIVWGTVLAYEPPTGWCWPGTSRATGRRSTRTSSAAARSR